MKTNMEEDSVVEYQPGREGFINLDQELDRIEQDIRSSSDSMSCIEDGESTMAKKGPRKITKTAEVSEATGHEYSAKDLAKELGMNGGALRKALRSINAKKPGKQWVWPKKSDPALEKIRKELKADSKPAAKKVKGGGKGE